MAEGWLINHKYVANRNKKYKIVEFDKCIHHAPVQVGVQKA